MRGNPLIRSIIAATLLIGAAGALGACGEDDDDSTETTEPTDTTEESTESTDEVDTGFNDTLLALQDLIGDRLEEDHGPVIVECPPEIAEGPGVYDCDFEVETTGETGVASVSTEDGSIDLLDVVVDG